MTESEAMAELEAAAKQQAADKWGVVKLGGDHGHMASVQWLAEDAVLSVHLGRCDGYGATAPAAVDDCLRMIRARRDKTRRAAEDMAARSMHTADLLRRRLQTL